MADSAIWGCYLSDTSGSKETTWSRSAVFCCLFIWLYPHHTYRVHVIYERCEPIATLYIIACLGAADFLSLQAEATTQPPDKAFSLALAGSVSELLRRAQPEVAIASLAASQKDQRTAADEPRERGDQVSERTDTATALSLCPQNWHDGSTLSAA